MEERKRDCQDRTQKEGNGTNAVSGSNVAWKLDWVTQSKTEWLNKSGHGQIGRRGSETILFGRNILCQITLVANKVNSRNCSSLTFILNLRIHRSAWSMTIISHALSLYKRSQQKLHTWWVWFAKMKPRCMSGLFKPGRHQQSSRTKILCRWISVSLIPDEQTTNLRCLFVELAI